MTSIAEVIFLCILAFFRSEIQLFHMYIAVNSVIDICLSPLYA